MNDENNAENGIGTDSGTETGNSVETRYELTERDGDLMERDEAIYPEGYDPESGEDFFPPETPPLPDTPDMETPAP